MGIKSNNPAAYYFNMFGNTGHDAGNPSTPPPMSASGGTEIVDGSYTYHVFVADGSFVASGGNGTVEALIIGGGGAARGDWPGGGGAGGLLMLRIGL